jgi:hypothetical protein
MSHLCSACTVCKLMQVLAAIGNTGQVQRKKPQGGALVQCSHDGTMDCQLYRALCSKFNAKCLQFFNFE